MGGKGFSCLLFLILIFLPFFLLETLGSDLNTSMITSGSARGQHCSLTKEIGVSLLLKARNVG